MFPKKKRIENEKLLESYRNQPCCVCGQTRGTVAHHLKTKGSGGDDTPENLAPLCVRHHREIHDKGLNHMMNNYVTFRRWFMR